MAKKNLIDFNAAALHREHQQWWADALAKAEEG